MKNNILKLIGLGLAGVVCSIFGGACIDEAADNVRKLMHHEKPEPEENIEEKGEED